MRGDDECNFSFTGIPAARNFQIFQIRMLESGAQTCSSASLSLVTAGLVLDPRDKERRVGFIENTAMRHRRVSQRETVTKEAKDNGSFSDVCAP